MSVQQNILARIASGSNEVFLLSRWGIWEPWSREGPPGWLGRWPSDHRVRLTERRERASEATDVELAAPILLLHGDADKKVPVKISDALAKARPHIV